ncbi:hypothetical protein N7495_001902 [Penicillium taxi]|uniref:uncharacterized protein n=1 Tax=Penicillium taxi TaxID=168475 RepID=UPI0025458905|nr:uncharacterized protein N7495_001902 [Penicillium taxi]KAJ5909220.1 hypothetical protein N7495_001902 [Penicillium taxi]
MADLKVIQVPPTNYISIGLFLGYLSIVIGLGFTCFNIIYVRYLARQKKNDWATPQRPAHFALFLFLSALSIGTTWFYMITYFVGSYNNWANSLEGVAYSQISTSTITRMDLWLQKTLLFQEAWETAVENPTRFWWSGQIFGWTIGWSLFVGIVGRRYRIPYLWVYMLLAQLVSVSFAANLFFVAVVVSQRPNEKDITFIWYPKLSYELVPVAFSLLDTVAVPIFAHKKEFMPILLAAHLMVFIPCILGPKGSVSNITKQQGEKTTRRYAGFIQWVAAASIILQAYLTALMMRDIGTEVSYTELVRRLLVAIYDHPACSSVSWDVINCTLSAIAWVVVHGFNVDRMLGAH